MILTVLHWALLWASASVLFTMFDDSASHSFPVIFTACALAKALPACVAIWALREIFAGAL